MLHMILTDFDGTLFSKENGSLEDAFVQKIKNLTDCGTVFAINSGRPYHTLRSMLKELEGRTVFICNDGAQIMYKNCLIYKHPIETKQANTVICAALKNGMTVFAALRERTEPITTEVMGKKGLFGQDIFKLIITKNKANSKAVENVKQTAHQHKLRTCFEDDIYLEFCAAEANKGNATAYLKKRFSINNNIAAFGDGENDIPMFDESDMNYVIENKSGFYYSGAKLIQNMQEFVSENF